MEFARLTCPDWRATEARMANAEAFLKTMLPVLLKDAPYGERYLAKDPEVLNRGKIAFAATCARCHSSKQPPDGLSADARTQWFREAVMRDDFLEGNFLSDDKRYSVREIGTNFARAAGTNATKGHVWDQFSSESYKALPAAGRIGALYNPRKPTEPITFNLEGGGRGYYRTASLTSIWATAPFLHNNSVGIFVKNPSVEGRLTAFADAIEKMLWPEKRLGVQSIPVTSVDSSLLLVNGHRLMVPAGTPVDLIARTNPTLLPRILRNRRVMELIGDRRLFNGMLERNQAPDFITDKGHTFGVTLPDEDKRALIEYLKTF
jgi:hypothetical protein